MKKLYFQSWLQPWGHRPRTRSTTQPHFSYRQILICWLGSFLSIALLTYLSIHTNYPLIAAPFGATAVILYAIPDSPLAQPRNVILGNCIGAIVCVTFVQCFGTAPWVIALSVATAIKMMQLTRTLHPPGGAVALVGAMTGASWNYLFTPVLAGSLIMVGCTMAFHRLAVRKTY